MNWSEWFDLYGPVVIGFFLFGFLGISWYTEANVEFFIAIIAILLFITLGLHRVFEYEHGFTVNRDTPTLHIGITSMSFGFFLVALQYNNVFFAISGIVLSVVTVLHYNYNN